MRGGGDWNIDDRALAEDAPRPSKTGTGRTAVKKKVSRSISRVLSWTIIHLRQVSPLACSDLPESTAGHS